jgi:hypothetical protein
VGKNGRFARLAFAIAPGGRDPPHFLRKNRAIRGQNGQKRGMGASTGCKSLTILLITSIVSGGWICVFIPPPKKMKALPMLALLLSLHGHASAATTPLLGAMASADSSVVATVLGAFTMLAGMIRFRRRR